MNIEKLTILRDTLESLQHEPNKNYPDIGFNMNYWHTFVGKHDNVHTKDHSEHGCGYVACIGGWADLILGSKHFLDLDGDIYYNLFKPNSGDFLVDSSKVTLKDAVTTLTKLIETGKVDWSHVQCE